MTRQYTSPRRALVDEVGNVYGRLTVVSLLGSCNKSIYYLCLCTCGKEVEVAARSLRCGNTTSCGCLTTENSKKASVTHGQSATPLYGLWRRMIQRCTDPNSSDYKYYGGRGITVATEWLDFARFKADMGDRPGGTSLDRIDNSCGYAPGNCRWATCHEQMSNTRGVKKITYEGETHSVAEWERLRGFKPGTLKTRLGQLGYSVEVAFNKPVKCGLKPGESQC